jgi:hypothetical protein
MFVAVSHTGASGLSQFGSATHSTQAPVSVLQCGASGPHSPLEVHATHVFVSSHTGALGSWQSALPVQATQAPLPRSQKGASPEQSSSMEQPTQVFVSVSQFGAAGSVQSALFRH